MAQSTVFDFPGSGNTVVAAIDAKRLVAVDRYFDGSTHQVRVYTCSTVFTAQPANLVDAEALYNLWRDRLDTFGGA